tara:strand:- start:7 stop:1431 length:1425 start_codon:yes stop_codon:yes gene_type:complete
MSEEDKWWSPDHGAGDEEASTPQKAAEDSTKEEIVGRENIDNFLEDIGYSDSERKKPKRTTTSGGDSPPTPQPPVVSGSQGFLGLWWLTRGEAVFVVCVTFFALVISAQWTYGLLTEPTFTETLAVIEAEDDEFWIEWEAEITGDGTSGTGWFQDDLSGWYEDCWTDEDGYEYCESYWVNEYECYADLYLTWNVSGVEYSDWAYTPSIITSYGCLAYMEQYYEIGDVIPIYYGESDPSQFQAFTITLGNSQSTHWTETMYHWAEGPNLYTDYECEAILSVTYRDPDNEATTITSRVLDGGNNPAFYGIYSPNSCLLEIMDNYSFGKTITVEVDNTDNSKVYREGGTPEGFYSITWFCCLGVMFILVILSFVIVRFNNTPPGNYVTRNGVVHHGGYDGNDVTIINNNYGNRWGYNEGPGVHYRKPSRRVSSSRRRSSSGGSRSSGGHSTRGRSGGGSSSGGGSRSSGGGRSGGRR